MRYELLEELVIAASEFPYLPEELLRLMNSIGLTTNRLLKEENSVVEPPLFYEALRTINGVFLLPHPVNPGGYQEKKKNEYSEDSRSGVDASVHYGYTFFLPTRLHYSIIGAYRSTVERRCPMIFPVRGPTPVDKGIAVRYD